MLLRATKFKRLATYMLLGIEKREIGVIYFQENALIGHLLPVREYKDPKERFLRALSSPVLERNWLISYSASLKRSTMLPFWNTFKRSGAITRDSIIITQQATRAGNRTKWYDINQMEVHTVFKTVPFNTIADRVPNAEANKA